jgi:hypothetical protein
MDKKIIGWNWSAFLFGSLWWFYNKLFVESVIVILLFSFLITFCEYISNFINTYSFVFRFVDMLPYLVIHIFSALFSNYRYSIKNRNKNCKKDKIIFLLAGIIIIIGLKYCIFYLFEHNKLYFYKESQFSGLLMAENKEEFLKEINRLGFNKDEKENENEFDRYSLDYIDNKIIIGSLDFDYTIIGIIFNYNSKQFFEEEIKPLLFLGKKESYNLNYKRKWINNRSITFMLDNNKIMIIRGGY